MTTNTYFKRRLTGWTTQTSSSGFTRLQVRIVPLIQASSSFLVRNSCSGQFQSPTSSTRRGYLEAMEAFGFPIAVGRHRHLGVEPGHRGQLNKGSFLHAKGRRLSGRPLPSDVDASREQAVCLGNAGSAVSGILGFLLRDNAWFA